LAFLGFSAPPHLGFSWLFARVTLAFVGFSIGDCRAANEQA
jgi:hypothetical protein